MPAVCRCFFSSAARPGTRRPNNKPAPRISSTHVSRSTSRIFPSAANCTLHQSFFRDDGERGEHRRTSERRSAECATEIAKLQLPRNGVAHEQRAHRHAGSDAFRTRQQIRRDLVLRRCERITEPADPGLDFVEDQKSVRRLAVAARNFWRKLFVAGRMPDMLWIGSRITAAIAEKSNASSAASSFHGKRSQGASNGV